MRSRLLFQSFVYWYTAIAASCGGGLALISRFRLWEDMNVFFSQIGEDYQSLLEHLLGGLAVPAIFVFLIIVAYLTSDKKKFEEAEIRAGWFVALRRRARHAIGIRYLFRWATAISIAYLLLELKWEIGQISEHGYFQWGQFAMDVAGVFAYFLAVCLFNRLSIKFELRQT